MGSPLACRFRIAKGRARFLGASPRTRSNQAFSRVSVQVPLISQGELTYTTIEPYQDLLLGRRIGRREEPEEQLVLIVRVVSDGEQARIRLANVEVDIGDVGTIDGEF